MSDNDKDDYDDGDWCISFWKRTRAVNLSILQLEL